MVEFEVAEAQILNKAQKGSGATCNYIRRPVDCCFSPPTLEAETLGFLCVQRSVSLTADAADADCCGWSVELASLWFGQYQELAVHSGRYMQDCVFQVYVPLKRVYCMLKCACARVC